MELLTVATLYVEKDCFLFSCNIFSMKEYHYIVSWFLLVFSGVLNNNSNNDNEDNNIINKIAPFSP